MNYDRQFRDVLNATSLTDECVIAACVDEFRNVF